jgi:catechol 2,3-dioxygenase-like lactoylglutathione lyase family enzyme
VSKDEVLDHISIQCRDVAAAAAFYDAVLGPLGGERIVDHDDVIGYGVGDQPTFWLGPLTIGSTNREVHVDFTAPDRDAVRAFFTAALSAGAEALHPPKSGPSITSTTSARTCATRTATTSRPSATGPVETDLS